MRSLCAANLLKPMLINNQKQSINARIYPDFPSIYWYTTEKSLPWCPDSVAS